MDYQGNGLYSFTGTLPAGKYEYKIAIGGSWDENYGENGVPGGSNIQLNLSKQKEVTFYYNDNTHAISDSVQSEPAIKRATIDTFNEVTITTTVPFDIKKQKVEINGVKIKNVSPSSEDGGNITNQVKITTEQELNLKKTYTVKVENYGEANTEIGKVVGSKKFDDLFYYDGNDLGNAYEPSGTKFRLWAPIASKAKLVIYKKWNDKTGTEIPMKQGEKGTWIAELKGDQKGNFYTYKVQNGSNWAEAVDPYVRATSVNGDKGAIVDLHKTNPKGWNRDKKPKLKNPEDSTIYELHVRDLSIQSESGIKNKGKYLGLAERGTRGPKDVTTGLDYIKDLGVTHVQLLPIADFEYIDETKLNEPQYNWGYATENFNVPEGSFSTNPYEPTVRITELKQMIQTLHDNDLRVVMDVVYNHTYNTAGSSFQKLVPGYYYRYNEDGTLVNGYGAVNHTASERKMVRKFMVDSVKYWAEEYHVDGFRFDLMGLHDVETMNAIRKVVNKIDPSIIIHGEGWDLDTPLAPQLKANQKNAYKMKGIGHFNDDIRDSLKGYVFDEHDKGFINGMQNFEERMKKGIMAGVDYDTQVSTYQDPEQVLTYFEAHDNHTLWDKLELTNPDDSEQVRKQMHKLASSIILTSQGIPFLHAGQEFMRTKYGDHNSYASPDSINQLDWARRAAFDKEVKYTKGLLELRSNHPAFRMTTAEQIRKNLTFINAPKNVVVFTLDGRASGDKAKQLIVAHNANKKSAEITLPSKGPWKVLVDGNRAGNKVLYVIKDNKITVPALSTLVLETGSSIK
ncbi:type I pullulanase (plasmid) [Priestia megaterium]|nr:type I pullulanase [Priestia megaterium]